LRGKTEKEKRKKIFPTTRNQILKKRRKRNKERKKIEIAKQKTKWLKK
jgi:hypothetical protein